jgi:FixJ family two-component response regulator
MSQLLIAIVDDEEPVRNATKSLVRSLGYHASTFGSADDFLKSEQCAAYSKFRLIRHWRYR